MSWTERDLPDLTGTTAIVTGANSGIGFHTAKHLAGRGATVVLACRNTDAAARAAASIRGETRVAELDLASLESVRRFAEGVEEPVDLLVNNAAYTRIVAPDRMVVTPWARSREALAAIEEFAAAAGLAPVAGGGR